MMPPEHDIKIFSEQEATYFIYSGKLGETEACIDFNSKDIDIVGDLYYGKPPTEDYTLLYEIEKHFYPRVQGRHYDSQSTGWLKAMGLFTYERLFPDAIRNVIRRIPDGALINLEIEDRLSAFPWELAFDGTIFLCLKYAFGRSTTERDDVLPEKSLSLLIISDPTGDLVGARRETNYILSQLRGFRQLRINRYGSEITKNQFLDLYSSGEFNLIHYSGHSMSDMNEPGKSSLYFRDEPCFGYEIEKLTVLKPPLLVFSNSCESAGVSYDSEELGNTSLAGSFLKTGVKGCIAALWPVGDVSSGNFASDFYRFLLFGSTIGDAVLRARKNSFKRWGYQDLIWASYILFGDPATKILNV
jgi:CHAT domain-containing protein